MGFQTSIPKFLAILMVIQIKIQNVSPSFPKLRINETDLTILIFGDSTVDSGNNNNIRTTAKANFEPYGMDFYDKRPTGRFCNGRLATDILAENLGIAKSIPAFLDRDLKLDELKIGVSFASASSGYDESTASNSRVLPFSKQIEYLRHYKLHLRRLVGPTESEKIMKKAIFLLSAGSNDIMGQYYSLNSSSNLTMVHYENNLITSMSNYIKEMNHLGGTRFVVVGVPPIGCLPIVKTLTGSNQCVDELNSMAISFNSKLEMQLGVLKKSLGAKTMYLDVFSIMLEAQKYPNKFGLIETSKGCCGTGTIEVGESCKGEKTCEDPSKYMFWDAVHPTEKMYEIIIDNVSLDIEREIFG